MQDAHIRDAYALCEFAALLQREIADLGNVDNWTEISAAAKLAELRAAQNLSRGDSFTTISASGSNAAVIHYKPVPKTDAKINDSAIYLGMLYQVTYQVISEVLINFGTDKHVMALVYI